MKELSTERRTLLAVVLSMIVMAGWTLYLQKKSPPKPPATEQPAPSATAPSPQPVPPATQTPAHRATIRAKPAPGSVLVRAATVEENFAVESALYRVEFSNRGATVRSWQLKKYQDDSKPPKVLDLVHADVAAQTGDWPLAIALADPQQAELEKRINGALFEVKAGRQSGASLIPGPAELVFEWSDGELQVQKRLKFELDYVVEIESSVVRGGQPLAHAIAWRGGFGDTTVRQADQQVRVFFHAAGKIEAIDAKGVGVKDHQDQRQQQAGTFEYAGIEDHYFAAAFLPAGDGSGISLWHWKFDRDATRNGATAKIPVAEVAVGSASAGPVELRLFVGPKVFDELRELRPPLTDLVQFGSLKVIAEPLFRLLQWIHKYAPNYGWAIVLMTFLINMALFPLKVISFRSMRKMQEVAPEMKQIQEKYKKYGARDPRKQAMQQEIMELYKRRGIDPTGGCVGGCLPMLLQMPIWFALYRMLGVAIELRHAAWLGWIRDLSQPDPYYILPIVMAATMVLMQKLTPTPPTTDPAQAKMMKLMPLMFGGMFVIFPVSSGLVLYILTSNVVGIGQQWFLNKMHAGDKDGGKKKGKKG